MPRRSLIAQIQEVEREIALRKRVYARPGMMKAAEAAEHLVRMESVLETLKWIRAHETRIKAAIGNADAGDGKAAQ